LVYKTCKYYDINKNNNSCIIEKNKKKKPRNTKTILQKF
jgi:hypothetical protein